MSISGGVRGPSGPTGDDLFVSDLGAPEGASAPGAPPPMRTTLALGEEGRGWPPGGGDVPGPVFTMALGEAGRAYARVMGERIDAENDAGLLRTFDRFLKLGNDDFGEGIRALQESKKLGALLEELDLAERDFIHTHPNVLFQGLFSQFREAARSKLGGETKVEVEQALKKFKRPLDAVKDGKRAGSEVAQEIELALKKKDLSLLQGSAGEIVAPFTSHFTAQGPFPYGKAKLDAALKQLDKDGKLGDAVKELKKKAPGLLDVLAKAVGEQGSKAVQKLWREAGGPKAGESSEPLPPQVTTFGPWGEEGRGGPEPPVATTMALGEEGRPKEDPGFTTLAMGEEGRWGGLDLGDMTTQALGEEGRGDTHGGNATTLAVNEEGRGGPTTLSVAEEGRGCYDPREVTFALGEGGRDDLLTPP